MDKTIKEKTESEPTADTNRLPINGDETSSRQKTPSQKSPSVTERDAAMLKTIDRVAEDMPTVRK